MQEWTCRGKCGGFCNRGWRAQCLRCGAKAPDRVLRAIAAEKLKPAAAVPKPPGGRWGNGAPGGGKGSRGPSKEEIEEAAIQKYKDQIAAKAKAKGSEWLDNATAVLSLGDPKEEEDKEKSPVDYTTKSLHDLHMRLGRKAKQVAAAEQRLAEREAAVLAAIEARDAEARQLAAHQAAHEDIRKVIKQKELGQALPDIEADDLQNTEADEVLGIAQAAFKAFANLNLEGMEGLGGWENVGNRVEALRVRRRKDAEESTRRAAAAGAGAAAAGSDVAGAAAGPAAPAVDAGSMDIDWDSPDPDLTEELGTAGIDTSTTAGKEQAKRLLQLLQSAAKRARQG